ncbi:MAG: cadherin-like beta sandwich domain-containing protein, partial [Deltaproteobacteria bacterium]|nr:cadherin-like beta sandwich domain-containing protein [Deltaproteobacteria bacterium]
MSKQPRSLLLALVAVAGPLALAACGGSSDTAIAALDGLTVSAGRLNPAFNKDITEYSATVPAGTLSVTVTATVSSGVSITVAQDSGTPTALASGQASAAFNVPARGSRSIITVNATLADGTSRAYTIALVQADSADATLASVDLSAGTLAPDFDSATTAYNLAIPAGTASFKLTPTATYANVASITVAQDAASPTTVASGHASQSLTTPAFGATSTIVVKVTAQNTYTTQTYTFTATQSPSTDATLATLKPSLGALSPAFASTTTAYTLAVPNGTTSITLTPKATNTNARSITLSRDGGAAATIVSNTAS